MLLFYRRRSGERTPWSFDVAFHTTLDIRNRQVQYMGNPYMVIRAFSKELKKGSADLLILALLEDRERHGYEIGRLIEQRSQGALSYHIASLYPTLYRLEDEGFVEGRWVEESGKRRRRYYKLTREGRKRLASERSVWQNFFLALDRIAGLKQS